MIYSFSNLFILKGVCQVSETQCKLTVFTLKNGKLYYVDSPEKCGKIIERKRGILLGSQNEAACVCNISLKY
jgi:hypothetical protein